MQTFIFVFVLLSHAAIKLTIKHQNLFFIVFHLDFFLASETELVLF